jgi:hypothetical protein
MYKTLHVFTSTGRDNFLCVVKGISRAGFEFASAKPIETEVGLQVTMLAKYCGGADDTSALEEAAKTFPYGSRIVVDDANPFH